MANNIVTFGLKNVHYSIATLSTTDGTWKFASPIELPGAQEFSSEIIGSASQVYADDKVVATLNQNAGRNITLKLTELTDEFKKDILGYKEAENGNLVEVTNAPVVTFALGFEIQGDIKARRTWIYLCTCAPISESTKSKSDSVEANAISLSITARPIQVDDDNFTTLISATKDNGNYATFLTTAPSLPVLK